MALSRPLLWIRNFALILVILAFVLVFGQPTSQSVAGAVAEVDGELIRRDVFEYFRSIIERQSFSALPADADRRDIAELLDRQTLQTLISRYILSSEARHLGLDATDRELGELLAADPGFRGAEGRYDPEIFEQFWRRSGFESDRVFMEERRRDILIRKLQRLVMSPIHVSDARVRDQVLHGLLKVRIHYAVARAENFTEGISLGATEIAAFEDAERISAAYQARLSEFQQPEQIRARHLLFEGSDALERARAARERLESAGADFAELARALSADEGTAERGGDLGFFPRGRMLEAFETAAFALEPGQLSSPVETERGVHLILLEERRAGIDRSEAEARDELVRDLLTEEHARNAARGAAEQLLAQLSLGQDFASAAGALALEPEESVSFSQQDFSVPGIGPVAGLKEAALALLPQAPHAERVFSAADAFFVISLLERDAPTAETLAAEMGPTRTLLEAQARDVAFGRWTEAARARLRQAGKIVEFPLYPAN